MFSNDFDHEMRETRGLAYYGQNDSLFRAPITFGEYEEVPRYTLSFFPSEQAYLYFVRNYPPVLFLDLHDIFTFLKQRNAEGYDAIDISTITEIVCNHLGDDTGVHDVLWDEFDDNVLAEVQARLGLDESNSLVSVPFNKAMGIIAEIAEIVQNYLVHANYPIVERQSIYAIGGVRNGILGLRLRTYRELIDTNG